VVKTWCVPVQKVKQRGFAMCSQRKVFAQVKLLLAQHKVRKWLLGKDAALECASPDTIVKSAPGVAQLHLLLHCAFCWPSMQYRRTHGVLFICPIEAQTFGGYITSAHYAALLCLPAGHQSVWTE
jgi:hypothetical protein